MSDDWFVFWILLRVVGLAMGCGPTSGDGGSSSLRGAGEQSARQTALIVENEANSRTEEAYANPS